MRRETRNKRTSIDIKCCRIPREGSPRRRRTSRGRHRESFPSSRDAEAASPSNAFVHRSEFRQLNYTLGKRYDDRCCKMGRKSRENNFPLRDENRSFLYVRIISYTRSSRVCRTVPPSSAFMRATIPAFAYFIRAKEALSINVSED